ncbi:hypothetical protein [Jiella pelagia]|uniref:Uncharacterized protein n=1 Tax=Jiella pelagia TaxID=2986949 RepID=A0ABY7C4D6_9HYPH|nr:hypothetical protein [Jiella pelagia]WAP70071.1 hypothetical protein OH818_08005 [Jiella pelagia]
MAHVDKHGTLFETISYNSPQLADLHRMVGRKEVMRCIDGEDLTSILVRVPKDFRNRFGPDPVDWLEVPSVDGSGDDRTLTDVLAENAAINEHAKREQQAGRSFRLSAHRRLLNEGRAAEKAAGLPSHELTQAQYTTAMKATQHKERAALGSVAFGETPVNLDPHEIGDVVGRAAKRQPARRRERQLRDPRTEAHEAEPTDGADNGWDSDMPFDGGTNLYGDGE